MGRLHPRTQQVIGAQEIIRGKQMKIMRVGVKVPWLVVAPHRRTWDRRRAGRKSRRRAGGRSREKGIGNDESGWTVAILVNRKLVSSLYGIISWGIYLSWRLVERPNVTDGEYLSMPVRSHMLRCLLKWSDNKNTSCPVPSTNNASTMAYLSTYKLFLNYFFCIA